MKKPIIVLLSLAALGTGALADTAFDNFDGSGGFNTGTGWTVSGASGSIGQDYDSGEQFVSATTGDVVGITIALGYVTGTNAATISLYEDNAGARGALKGSWAISNMGVFGTAYTPSFIGVGPGVSLTTGNAYWLVADSADDAWTAWNWNNIGGTGGHLFSNGGTDNYSVDVQGAFRVDTRVVPEPVSMIGLAAGLAAIARRKRK